MRPEDLQATYCATLVDEWRRAGVAHAVVAPGSRSTPLALALAAEDRLRLHVHPDERSAAFLALGIGRATGRPAVVLTTSGTAAVELHPAIVEAHHAGVPLLACTADRPPELRDVGAPQAIDQTHLFGRSVRWFHDPGVPDEATLGRARALARRAVRVAVGARPGPVHLNLPFREPLLGVPGPQPEPLLEPPPGLAADGSAAGAVAFPAGDERARFDVAAWVGRRGVVVAGERSGTAAAVTGLAEVLGWPVLATPLAAAFAAGIEGGVVVHADALLRVPALRDELRPEVVLRLGDLPASRVVNEWIAASGAVTVAVPGAARWIDPFGPGALVLDGDPGTWARRWTAALDGRPQAAGAWRARWLEVARGAAVAVEEALAGEAAATEPAVARAVLAATPEGGALVVSSSMPVRDLEWYGAPRSGVAVHANRGANGIDGVVSTAVGVAVGSGAPTVALVGDLACIHDANGLVGAGERGVSLVVVVVHNDGGGIFSFLPQATSVDTATFEQLFGTPHGIDLVARARAVGVDAVEVAAVDDVAAEVEHRLDAGGAHLVLVRTDRRANVAVHERLHRAVATGATGPARR